MKGTLRALVLILVVGSLMVPAIAMSIEEQGEEDEEGNLQVDETTEDLEPIFSPLTTAFGALLLFVGVGILFSWLGVFG